MQDLLKDAEGQFNALMETSFIEGPNRSFQFKSSQKESKHQSLFNEIWNRYKKRDYLAYVNRYVHRLKINALLPNLRGNRVIDLGCGNGNFCLATLKCGARFAAGVDFGEKSIAYAKAAAQAMGYRRRTDFRCETVYRTSFPSASFDFAIQNGVFHHLDDEDAAIEEARRLLKPGGWLWYYVDGEGGISYDLWDTSVRILSEVPIPLIEQILNLMNVSRNKTVHLMDGLSATYAHTNWKKVTSRLASHGFYQFQRLVGGFPTDFDEDRILSDRYGRAKFGSGDLRILCQKRS